MDQLHTRLEALEQRTHTVERQLHWWRGVAGGLLVLAVLTRGLPVVTADDAKKDLEQRVAALEKLLKHFRRDGNEITIKGANLHIINGLGSTDCTDEQGEPTPECPNGLGNLIVGYNEPRQFDENLRTGSHNVVVGQFHNFSRFGGLVVGDFNTINGDFAVVSGGFINTASGAHAAVSGGQDNTASGFAAAVSGGVANTASGTSSSVSGGGLNTASGPDAAVSGGEANTANGFRSAINGGSGNTASGLVTTVSGGRNRTAEGEFDWDRQPLRRRVGGWPPW